MLYKIIHQSWKTRDIPRDLYREEWQASWKELNPEWSYILWTDEDNRGLIKTYYPQFLNLYDSYERGVDRADIARFFYMHKYGGLYVDLDFQCLKPLDELLKDEKMVLGSQHMTTESLKENRIPNALKYSVPGEDFWLQCIKELPAHQYTESGALTSAEVATGPVFLLHCIEKFKPKDLTIVDPEIFYPISWDIDGAAAQENLRPEWLSNPAQCFPKSYAVTFWTGGWQPLVRLKRKAVSPILTGVSKAFYINLDHRTDRKKAIEKRLTFAAERRSAVWGNDLELSTEIRQLFSRSLNKLSKAEIGCILSHYYLWKQLAEDKKATSYLILEDDAVFVEGFTEKWNLNYGPNLPKDFFIIYLGGSQPYNAPHYDGVLEPFNPFFNNIACNNHFSTTDSFWHMTTSSYLLSKEAASRLCQYVEQRGFDRALDHFLVRFFTSNKLFDGSPHLFHTHPLLSYQVHEEGGACEIPDDSDIRHSPVYFDPRDTHSPSDSLQVLWLPNPPANGGFKKSFERDWLTFLLGDKRGAVIDDTNWSLAQDNSIVIYSDILSPLSKSNDRLKDYFNKFKDFKNCYLIHLSDEFCHADISHYKHFTHVFRNYFREDAQAPNVTFFPLGYKQGFNETDL